MQAQACNTANQVYCCNNVNKDGQGRAHKVLLFYTKA
jgi:hypothetical protein